MRTLNAQFKRFSPRQDWQGLALLALIIAAALNRYRLEILGVSLRPEHGVLFLVLAGWGWQVLKQRRVHLTLTRLDAWLVVYLILAVLTSLLNAPNWRESLKYCAIMFSGALVFWLVRNLVGNSPARLLAAFKALLGVGLGVAVYGLVAWLVFPFGPNFDVTLYRLGSGPAEELSACTYSSHATLVEPNLFASFLVCLLLAGLTWFGLRKPNFSWRQAAFLGLIDIGIGLSLTRGAWLALAAGVFLFFLVAPVKRLALLAGSGLVGLLVTVTLVGANFQVDCRLQLPVQPGDPVIPVRVTGVAAPGQPAESGAGEPAGAARISGRLLSGDSVNWRLSAFGRAIEDWQKKPLLGLGANSFAQSYVTTSNTPDWIGNMFLMALHDTGLLGLALLVGWCGWLAWDTWRAIKNSLNGNPVRSALLALSLGLVSLLVAYQFSTAFWLGFSWVVLGLTAAALSLLGYQGGGQKPLLVLRLGRAISLEAAPQAQLVMVEVGSEEKPVGQLVGQEGGKHENWH